MPLLDGPRLEPRGQAADALVVLLHGYGANGEDLIALGGEWQRLLPRAVFVAPDAPDLLPGAGFGGRQWFPLTFRDPGEYWRGVSQAGPLLERFLDAELTRCRLPPERLALVGFSQGTMLALHAGLRRRTAPAAVVGYSGMLAGPEHVRAEMRCRPPILLVHGSGDDVIPVEALHVTREALAQAGLSIEWHERPGLGHGIDPAGLMLGGDFLSRQLSARAGSASSVRR